VNEFNEVSKKQDLEVTEDGELVLKKEVNKLKFFSSFLNFIMKCTNIKYC
jgi:hypothetical protein